MFSKTECQTFEEQLSRIQLVTGRRTPLELAELFGIRQSVVAEAMRREQIPTNWLSKLARLKRVNPAWILTGEGSCFLSGEHCEAEQLTIQEEYDDILRQLPTRALVDELARRMCVLLDSRC